MIDQLTKVLAAEIIRQHTQPQERNMDYRQSSGHYNPVLTTEALNDECDELDIESFELEHCVWAADPQEHIPTYVDYLLGRHSGRFCH